MTFQASPKTNRDVSDDILRAIEELKTGTGFGSVEIIIHEGRVTQIEKREKIRFTLDKSKSSPTALAAAK
ncbi:MAG TPA: YezD family protein [Methylophilaceae bacterium]|nr:YezD family protein [Methylophilaceae bacterium]HQC28398.1 YezD family protein [Methylotenera sp.]